MQEETTTDKAHQNGHDKNPALAVSPFAEVLPAQAIPLEKSTLGAILIDREALYKVLEILSADKFYMAAHGIIFQACIRLYQDSRAVDILTVTEELRKMGDLVKVGGAEYIIELTNMVASGANLEYHARIIWEKWILRTGQAVGTEMVRASLDPTTDAWDFIQEAQKKTSSLGDFGGKGAEPPAPILARVLKQVADVMESPDGVTGVPTGLRCTDHVYGGFQPKKLYISAGRPGMGKTALALKRLLSAAKAGFPVLLNSLEMPSEEIIVRLIAMESGLDSSIFTKGPITDTDLQKMQSAAETIAKMPIHIDDEAGLNVFTLCSRARRMQQKHGIKLLIVDYLQLMSGDEHTRKQRGNREQEISAISRALKDLSKELGIPVIALSQLSRAVETRGGSKRPILSDLRESGAIEQDADVVEFIYRPEYYGIFEDEQGVALKATAEIIISKHRGGCLDTLKVYFHDIRTYFGDMSEKPEHIPASPVPASAGMPSERPTDEDIPF